MKEKTLSSEYIYKGKILNLRKDLVQTTNGTSTREIVEHEEVVVVIPFEKPDKIYLVKQFRKPLEKEILEAPAGCVDKNEDILSAAKRELVEETGFHAKTWVKLGSSYPSPGFSTELMHYYLATGLEQSQPSPDEDEEIEVVSLDLKTLEKMIFDNTIIDAKTIISCFLLQKEMHYI
ncbi:NUDIX hydrolase [Candidatus Margulisiibacteriota bacterium]